MKNDVFKMDPLICTCSYNYYINKVAIFVHIIMAISLLILHYQLKLNSYALKGIYKRPSLYKV